MAGCEGKSGDALAKCEFRNMMKANVENNPDFFKSAKRSEQDENREKQAAEDDRKEARALLGNL